MIAYKYANISILAYKITRKMFWRAADETSEERISFHLSKKMICLYKHVCLYKQYISTYHLKYIPAYISTYHVLK